MLKSVIDTLGKIWKSEGQESLQTPQKLNVKFILAYKDLKIGFLKLDAGVWTFEYSDDFKNQNDIQPLTDFPDVDKIYQGELAPFFLQRIPSLSQPKVMQVIEEENIDQTNEVELLKHFGKTSINNPFRLQPVF